MFRVKALCREVSMVFPGVLIINRQKPIIGNPIDQSMVINVNYLIDID
jgi:hypothetical protein